MPTITIDVPLDNKTVKATGSVAVIKIGDVPVRFIVQTETDGRPNPAKLTHIGSGFIAVNSAKISNIRKSIYGITSRKAAEMVLEGLVNTKGADFVLSTIKHAPIINPGK